MSGGKETAEEAIVVELLQGTDEFTFRHAFVDLKSRLRRFS